MALLEVCLVMKTIPLLLTILTALVLLVYLVWAGGGATGTEGFAAASPTEAALERLNTAQLAGRALYHNQRAISNTNPNQTKALIVDKRVLATMPDLGAQLTAALEDQAVGEPRDFGRFIHGVDMSRDLKFEACRGIVAPENIRRNYWDEEGCGWLFVPDAYGGNGVLQTEGQSLAVFGTAAGVADGAPANVTADVAARRNVLGARWIWDIAEATEAESIKQCRRQTSCAATNTAVCAFCPTLGYAVPYDRPNARAKYVRANCGGPLVTLTAQCPGQTTTGEVTVTNCCSGSGPVTLQCLLELAQTLGIPNTSRLYVWIHSKLGAVAGACTINAPPAGTAPAADMVISAYLSILRLHKITTLTVGDLTTPPQTRTLADFRTELMKIQQARTGSVLPLVRNTAISLVNVPILTGTAATAGIVNFCDHYVELAGNTETAAAAVQCLQQQFRLTGCQASGRAYPSSLNSFVGRSLQDITDGFRALFQRMNSALRLEDQEEAIADCLGATGAAGAIAAPTCDEKGIDYYVFADKMYVGRVRSMVGLLVAPRDGQRRIAEKASDLKQMLGAAKVSTNANTVSYIARFKVVVPATPAAAALMQFDPSTYTVQLNGRPLPNNAPTSALGVGRLNVFDVIFTSNGTDWGAPQMDYATRNLKNIQRTQPGSAPLIAWNFRDTRSFQDANNLGVLDASQVVILPTGMTWREQPSARGDTTPVVRMTNITLQSQRVRMITLTTTLRATGVIFRLVGPGGWIETCRVTTSQQGGQEVMYETQLGALPPQVARWSVPASMTNSRRHLAVAYTKNTDPITGRARQVMDMFVDGQRLTLTPETNTNVVTYNDRNLFNRHLEVQLLDRTFNGVLESFRIYDDSLNLTDDVGSGGVEGFADSGGISLTDLISFDAGTSRRTVPTEAPERPTTATDQYELPAQFRDGARYGSVFSGIVNPLGAPDTTVSSARECADSCATNTSCLGFTYMANSCQLFDQIPDPPTYKNADGSGGITVTASDTTKSLSFVNNQFITKQAIEDYRDRLIKVLRDGSLQGSSVYEAMYPKGSSSEPRTLDQVEADLVTVSKYTATDERGAMLDMYRKYTGASRYPTVTEVFGPSGRPA